MVLTDDFIDEALVRFARSPRIEFARYIEKEVMAQMNLKIPQQERDALKRIIGMCDVPGRFCTCGRPNGLGAVIAYARGGLGEEPSVLDMTSGELYHAYLDNDPNYQRAIARLRDDVRQETLARKRKVEALGQTSRGGAHQSTIAGALFDFASHLTTLDETYLVGGKHDASRMVRELKVWALKRGLRLEDADVMHWNRGMGK